MFEDLLSSHQAGAGHGRVVPRQDGAAAVARRHAGMLVIRVRGDAGHAEHDPDMLKPPVRIEQLRTDGADTRLL